MLFGKGNVQKKINSPDNQSYPTDWQTKGIIKLKLQNDLQNCSRKWRFWQDSPPPPKQNPNTDIFLRVNCWFQKVTPTSYPFLTEDLMFRTFYYNVEQLPFSGQRYHMGKEGNRNNIINDNLNDNQ